MWKRSAVVGFVVFAGVAAIAAVAQAPKPAAPAAAPVIMIDTAKGVIEIEMQPQDAPKSVDHILALVRKDFYRGQRFYYVTGGVVQLGDPQSRNLAIRAEWGKKGSGQPIGLTEFTKKSFVRGTLGLAYINDPKMADSQFFIVKGDLSNQNGKYTMIGHVTKGMDVVDKIELDDVVRLVSVKGEAKK